MTVVKIGTRGSPLALTQTKMVQTALAEQHPALQTEIVVIKTSGDWRPSQGETRLREEDGGKGQFAKEIEEALLNGEIDIGVHSMKDMETALPEGLVIAHMLPREDPRDALLLDRVIAVSGQNITTLEKGTIVGTASVRRQAFLLAQNKHLTVVPLRGNVQTRIEKLRAGQVQATLLAYAGLKRLGLAHEADAVLDTEIMLPAAGQGAVGIEMRADDARVANLLDPISCRETLLCVSAERGALAALDGSCHTPIGAHATLQGNNLFLRLKVASLDGKQVFSAQDTQNIKTQEEAKRFGQSLGERLKSDMPPEILTQRIESA